MIDVSELISDPDLAQPYTVYRQTGSWVQGKFVLNPETAIPFYGAVIAANTKDIMQLPEGDRVKGLMCFYSVSEEPLYVTRNSPEKGISDQVEWRGERYKIFQTWPYGDYGYWKCMGARMAGD